MIVFFSRKEIVSVLVCALAAASVFTGCNSSDARRVVPGSAIATPKLPTDALTDKQKIELLRGEARKRGLRWSITCMNSEKPEAQFFAMAEDKRVSPDATFIEDGALPWWAADGATQSDAAYNLYLLIQKPPNIQPAHKSQEVEHHKVCPPQLRGE